MPNDIEIEDRRKFLISCGKFAAVTPPAMASLLSTSLTSTAIARSGSMATIMGRVSFSITIPIRPRTGLRRSRLAEWTRQAMETAIRPPWRRRRWRRAPEVVGAAAILQQRKALAAAVLGGSGGGTGSASGYGGGEDDKWRRGGRF